VITRENGFDVLARLSEAGYRFTVGLEPTQPERHPRTVIKIDGPDKPTAELAELIAEHRDALKAAVLLSNPPGWLERLFDLWFSGHETPVRLDNGVYMVRVSVKNIAAAVAADIGMDPLEWEKIREEVEEAMGSWEGA
jgi:hypothetical protein